MEATDYEAKAALPSQSQESEDRLDCGQTQVYRGCCIVPLFERYSVPGYHSLVESKPGFRAVPIDEFSDRMIVRPLGAGRGQVVQYRRFGLLKVGELGNRFGCPLVRSSIPEKRHSRLTAKGLSLRRIRRLNRKTALSRRGRAFLPVLICRAFCDHGPTLE